MQPVMPRMETDKGKKIQLAIFASGSGSNAEEIIVQSFRIDSPYTVKLVLGNNSGAMVFTRALMYNVPTLHISAKTHPDPDEFARTMLAALQNQGIDMIVLAGYMKKVPVPVIEAYKNRIINTHPALLPKHGGKGMYGLNVHRAVLEAGERETGVSVHLVDEQYDTGAVIAREKVAVVPGESPEELAERVKKVEHRLLPETIRQKARELLGA